MARRTRETRFDLRKGLNTSFSDDIKDRYELARIRNGRLYPYGAVTKTAGSQRLHSTSIGSGAKVLGLYQWVPTGGTRELIGISGGNLYHKVQVDANFTAVASSLSTTARPVFAEHVLAGTPTLYFADGALRKWTGAALSTSISGAPAATFIVEYRGRMFACDGATKVIYWSDIDDPETWASPDGGQANASTHNSLPLVGLGIAGDTLLLFKNNSVARFSGVDQTDIQIDQDSFGISDDVGTIAPKTIIKVEEVIFFLTERGPYVATSAGVQAVGTKIENVFDDAEMDYLPQAVAVHHKGRREVWVFFPENAETTNTVGYCFNYRQQSWTGPWDMADTFDVCAAASYDLNNGVKSVVLGGYDGFVRRGDVVAVGGKHDVLSDSTGGTNITLALELPTIVGGDPKAIKKFLNDQQITANLKTAGSLSVKFTGDIIPGTQTVVLASKGTGRPEQYPFQLVAEFRRGTITIEDATSELVQINGILLDAGLFNRAA